MGVCGRASTARASHPAPRASPLSPRCGAALRALGSSISVRTVWCGSCASSLPLSLWSAQHSSTSLGCGVKTHVRLSVDSPAGRVRTSREAPPQEEGARARVRGRARAATAATGTHQQQGLQAEAEHVPHKRRTVRAWALPSVSGGYCQGGNATRGLCLCQTRAVHSALALHRSRVHRRTTLSGHPFRL